MNRPADDPLIARLNQVVNYLNRTSQAALADAGVSEVLPDPETAPSDRTAAGQTELGRLLVREASGQTNAEELRRIAELTELLLGEQEAEVWWDRAAREGDPVAIMMLADEAEPSRNPKEGPLMDRPTYTDEDLRVEAAIQYTQIVEDPDFMGVGERMKDSEVESLLPPLAASQEGADGATWSQLLPQEADGGSAYSEAQRKIHDLINGAADLSAWAVNLGADGLKPSTSELTVRSEKGVRVRVHFAFAPDLDKWACDSFMNGVGNLTASGISATVTSKDTQ